jgi:hypothetical protein
MEVLILNGLELHQTVQLRNYQGAGIRFAAEEARDLSVIMCRTELVQRTGRSARGSKAKNARLFGWDERAVASYAEPSILAFDPGVCEA